MKKLNEYRLTSTELLYAAPQGDWPPKQWRAVADAATEKALRGVVAWLRERGPMGYTTGKMILSDTADQLETMLAEEQPRG